MVMLHQLHAKYGAESLGVAHCNFQLRGTDSDGDEQLVRSQCEQYGIRCFVKRFDTKSYAAEQKLSIQESARNLRFAYFFELKASQGFERIATAHHADDAIETFFINLMRGSGPRGLSGITEDPERGLIRPMLHLSRAEIEAYAQSHKIQWREDSSNASDAYLRNQLRHQLLPLMHDLKPGFGAVMHRNMAIQAQVDVLIKTEVAHYSAAHFKQLEEHKWELARTAHPSEALLVAHILSPFGFNATQVMDLIEATESGKQSFSASHVLSTRGNAWLLEQRQENSGSTYLIERDLESSHVSLGIEMELLDEVPDSLNVGNEVALLDLEKLDFPLTIRPWQAGDRMQPLGMQGVKNVSDILSESGLSLQERARVSVVLSGDEICWLMRHRISERFKVQANSKQVLRISLKPH